MGETHEQSGNFKKQKPSLQKKLSTRVDLTPMVDLGFLLITFFIFTTSMNEPRAMRLILPHDSSDSSRVADSKTITLLLGRDNRVWYYPGNSLGSIKESSFSIQGIRQVLIDKKRTLHEKFNDASGLVVIIKPTSSARYQNIVDVLDEMSINAIAHYSIAECSKEETDAIEN